MSGAKVHLSGAAGRTVKKQVRLLGQLASGILAAAVHHNCFMRSMSLEGCQSLCQTTGFIESRDDDRDTHEYPGPLGSPNFLPTLTNLVGAGGSRGADLLDGNGGHQ